MAYSKYYVTITDGVEELRIEPFIQIKESGIVYAYNEFKSKWLSINRFEVNFYNNHKTVNSTVYLKQNNIPSNINPFVFQDNSTISEIVCNSKENNTGTIKLQTKRSGIVQFEYEVNFISEMNKRIELDQDVLQYDTLNILISSGMFDYPKVIVKYNIKL